MTLERATHSLNRYTVMELALTMLVFGVWVGFQLPARAQNDLPVTAGEKIAVSASRIQQNRLDIDTLRNKVEVKEERSAKRLEDLESNQKMGFAVVFALQFILGAINMLGYKVKLESKKDSQ